MCPLAHSDGVETPDGGLTEIELAGGRRVRLRGPVSQCSSSVCTSRSAGSARRHGTVFPSVAPRAVRTLDFENRGGNQISWEAGAEQASRTTIDEGRGVLHRRKHKKQGKARLRSSL